MSELRSRCSTLPELRDEQRQLVADAAESDRLAALNSELRLRSLDLSGLQQEAQRLGPLAEESRALKQQVQEMQEDAADLPAVKVRTWIDPAMRCCGCAAAAAAVSCSSAAGAKAQFDAGTAERSWGLWVLVM